MEVTVFEARNAPANPILSVRMGPSNREAPLKANQTLHLPHPGRQQTAVEVRIFEALGQQVLPTGRGPEALCSIPVLRPNGSKSEVKLRVRRTKGGGSRPLSSKSPTHSRAGQDQALDAIQGIMQEVIKEQPGDPRRVMLERLRGLQLQGGVKKPRPPAQPCPSHPGRPALQRQEGSPMRPGAAQLQAEVRFSIRLCLSGGLCTAVARLSMWQQVRREAARDLTLRALGAARHELASRASEGAPAACLKRRGSRRPSVGRRPSTIKMDRDKFKSLPVPVVLLEAGSSSWGQWLTTDSDPMIASLSAAGAAAA